MILDVIKKQMAGSECNSQTFYGTGQHQKNMEFFLKKTHLKTLNY